MGVHPLINRLRQFKACLHRLLIGNWHSFKYDKRLQYLNLASLQCRRVKADLIMSYKVLHDLVEFSLANGSVLTHPVAFQRTSWDQMAP